MVKPFGPYEESMTLHTLELTDSALKPQREKQIVVSALRMLP
jgi:hypothetical protein